MHKSDDQAMGGVILIYMRPARVLALKRMC